MVSKVYPTIIYLLWQWTSKVAKYLLFLSEKTEKSNDVEMSLQTGTSLTHYICIYLQIVFIKYVSGITAAKIKWCTQVSKCHDNSCWIREQKRADMYPLILACVTGPLVSPWQARQHRIFQLLTHCMKRSSTLFNYNYLFVTTLHGTWTARRYSYEVIKEIVYLSRFP